MPDVTREHEVSAPPDAVSAVILDLPGWSEWFALHKGWVQDPPARAARGVKFRHRMRILGVPADITWEFTEVDPPRRFTMKGRGSQRTSAAVLFEIRESGTGSLIRIEAEIGGLVLRPVKGQLRGWLEPRIERTLAALETQAQARA